MALLPKRTRGELVELLLNLHFGSLPALQGQRTAAAKVGAMLATGTKTKSRSELADAFTAPKADWRVGSSVLDGADAALSARKAQLAPALKLLAEVLREPAFAAAEREQLVRQRIGEREAWADSAEAVAGIMLRHAETADLPADDPRRMPTLAQGIAALKALRLEDVQAFHRNFWGAQHGELAIVGDFDAATIKPLIAQLFGDWRSPQHYMRIPAHRPALAGQRFVSPLKDKANAVVQGSLTKP